MNTMNCDVYGLKRGYCLDCTPELCFQYICLNVATNLDCAACGCKLSKHSILKGSPLTGPSSQNTVLLKGIFILISLNSL